MVEKFLDDNKPKIHLKVNSQCLLAKFSSGLNPKGPYLNYEKEKNFFYCVHLLREVRKFHVAVVQRWLKNVQKSLMHVQSCCLTNINLLLFSPFSFPSPSLLPKLTFVVIQKLCYHGNVTSNFSSLCWRVLKSWFTVGDPQQGFQHCLADGLNQKFSSVWAGYFCVLRFDRGLSPSGLRNSIELYYCQTISNISNWCFYKLKLLKR